MACAGAIRSRLSLGAVTSVCEATSDVNLTVATLPMRPGDGLIYEYACHEGNYSMEGILKGARAQEKAAVEPKKDLK